MNTPTGNPHRYDDIIGLEHPISKTHPPMARIKRAAQFASFDALTGFGEAIYEAGREAEEKLELSEDMIEMIDAKLAVIEQHIKERPSISVTYFLPDDKKAGGRYVTVSGNVQKLDGMEHIMVLADGTRIPIENIRYIEGEIFQRLEY